MGATRSAASDERSLVQIEPSGGELLLLWRPVTADRDSDRWWVAGVLGQAVAEAATAAWAFQNRTDIVTLAGGDQAVWLVTRDRSHSPESHASA